MKEVNLSSNVSLCTITRASEEPLQGKHPCSEGFYGTSPTNLSLLCLLWRLIVEVE